AASGTDLHLLAAQLAAPAEKLPLLAVMLEPSESGSGVPAALAGRHFGSLTTFADKVVEGGTIAHARPVDVETVPARSADGVPRRLAAGLARIGGARGHRQLWIAAALGSGFGGAQSLPPDPGGDGRGVRRQVRGGGQEPHRRRPVVSAARRAGARPAATLSHA